MARNPPTENGAPPSVRLRAALAGCGRWGTRLLGALHRHPAFNVVALADPDAAARVRARDRSPGLVTVDRLGELFAFDPDVVLIATPSPLHAEHALAVLEAGIDAFVEKPLALRSSDALRLDETARRRGRIGMVGHVLRYHAAVVRVVELVQSGKVGVVHRVEGRRWTQSGSADPLWTLGPHDLSTLHAIDGSAVRDVSAQLGVLTQPSPGTDPPVTLEIRLESGLEACFELSTAASRPDRRLTVSGSGGQLELDELDPSSPLSFVPSSSAADRRAIELEPVEPLAEELSHLAQCLKSRSEPRTSLKEAAWVVAQLERAQAVGRPPRSEAKLQAGPRDMPP